MSFRIHIDRQELSIASRNETYWIESFVGVFVQHLRVRSSRATATQTTILVDSQQPDCGLGYFCLDPGNAITIVTLSTDVN